MSFGLRVIGDEEIDKALKLMDKELSHKFWTQVNADRAKPLVQKAKLLAPEGPTGNLVDSIGTVKSSLKKANDLGETKTGPRRRGRARAYHAHLVEFGTKRRENKSGANRGIMPKNPFMANSWASTKMRIETGIKESVQKKLISTMKKTLKNNFIK